MKADIIWLGSTDSTNKEAKRHISEIDNLSVLSAFRQTSGRGQRGNIWSSEAGENLTFSIILKFPEPESNLSEENPLKSIRAYDQFVLTEIASLSVVKFLSDYGVQAKIKWPNDIYVGSRKICGMLIENSVRGELLSSSIIGIGLNINQRNFDVNIPNPTSLAILSSSEGFDIRRCLEKFIDIFLTYLERYMTAGTEEDTRAGYMDLRKEYLENLWLLDTPSTFIDLRSGEREFRGIIRGLSPFGLLQIEDIEKGAPDEYAFKEIGYIIR